MHDVVVLGGLRSAIGSFGGSLAQTSPITLGATVARAALRQSALEAEQIDHVAMGHVINTEARDMYLARAVAMDAGVPSNTPAMTVNRLCGSGLQAVISMVQSIALGDADFALAGGAECMSRAPHIVPALRWGRKTGDSAAQDMLLGALTCPFGSGHMGATAETIAAAQGISREDQDAFAQQSQTRARTAIAAGRFRDQIVPVPVVRNRATVAFDTDEHPQSTTLDKLAGLPPAFRKSGTVTAGNASGLNDGAAALLLASEPAARAAGLRPRARILGYAHAGVAPEIMGMGPVPAVRKLLARSELGLADFDVIESNEAFAAQALAVNRALGLDAERVNPNGGAIALGHPVGATGAILLVKALHELERRGAVRALITMCIGGGQGIALALERLDG